MLHFSPWKIFLILAVNVASIVIAIPSLLPDKVKSALPGWFPSRSVSLGLDLQGGSQLLLAIDFDAYMREQLTMLTDDVRRTLRSEKINYKDLAARDGKVFFTLSGEGGQDVPVLLKKINPDISVEKNGGEYAVNYGEKWVETSRQRLIEQSIQIVDRRINETGTKEPIIQRQGADRILLQVPGLADPEHLKRLLGRTAKMTFHLVNMQVTPEETERGIVPAGTRIVSSADKDDRTSKYAVFSRVLLSGDMLVDANMTYNSQTGEPVVSFRFNNAGARKFADITAENVGKPFAILLDNKVITAPVIRSPIMGGSGIISGNFTAESANDLALLLRAGALPVPLTVIEERSVGPSLGSDSIVAGSKAFIIAIVLVVIFMVLFYGLFGLFANIAMVLNAFMVIALLALFEATLTMPGIAGIVLTMGMAVDTNVLIYERMREELRNGKTPFAAVGDGFRLAFGTIIDSHVTTLSAALILFYFGTGTVKGFAVTLTIGILCSLYTAVLVTRLMVATWMGRKRPKILTI